MAGSVTVSVWLDEISDFLKPVDPKTDFERVLELADGSNALATLLPFTFRETLVAPVPHSRNERLPVELALREGESALKLAPHNGYIYSRTLDLYVLARHKFLETLALQEISDKDFPNLTHGISASASQSCSGPLCRRARRIQRVEADFLRRSRTHFQKTGKPYRPSGKSRYEQIKQSVPQYAAVEPLLTALTVLAHLRTPPSKPSKQSRIYLAADSKERLVDLLGEHFGVDAFGIGQVAQIRTI